MRYIAIYHIFFIYQQKFRGDIFLYSQVKLKNDFWDGYDTEQTQKNNLPAPKLKVQSFLVITLFDLFMTLPYLSVFRAVEPYNITLNLLE